MSFEAKLSSGTTRFPNGLEVTWNKATQGELKKVYELGYTKFVTKIDKDVEKPKAKKSKGKAQAKLSEEQGEQ